MGVEVTIRMELPADLAEHVRHETGEFGGFDSVEAYVSELIRRDMATIDDAIFTSHEAEVRRAFATPSSEFVVVTAEEVIARNRKKRA